MFVIEQKTINKKQKIQSGNFQFFTIIYILNRQNMGTY